MNNFHVDNGHCILTLCLDCEFIILKNSHAPLRSHTKNSCFVFHESIQTPRNNKSTRPRAFISFSVFGHSDETLALVFDILLTVSTNKRQVSYRVWKIGKSLETQKFSGKSGKSPESRENVWILSP